MEGASLGNNKTTQFLHLISSWSLDHILNNQLYNFQVEEIPKTFDSVQTHLSSFVNPLLEETRCELALNMEMIHESPFAEITSFSKAKGNKEMVYDVIISAWRNGDCGQEPYRTIPDDLLILVDEKPTSISDLKHLVGMTRGFAIVDKPENVNKDDNNPKSVSFKVEASKHIEFRQGMFVVFLMNITTQKRIWNSLHMKGTNLETGLGYLREVAEMFNSIDKHERAGECFMLAGCHSDAAEAYAKGDQFSNCLTACKKGELFNKGMEYIEHWKEHAIFQDNEIEQIRQEFLESCALYHHECEHPISMMGFVRAFRSMESKRAFLRSLGRLDELVMLEEESGHFLEAAEVVKSWGDVLKEAKLYEKAGQCLEAIMLILRYMFFSSLWGFGNKGWPLKHFPQKERLSEKAMSLSRRDSETTYGHICREVEILYDERSSLSDLKKLLEGSKQHQSLRGEMVSIRKILDAHLHLNSSKYDWEDELPLDIRKHSEGMIFLNRVSVRTLVFYWNMWKDHVVEILQSLGSLESEEEPDEHDDGYIEFCLDYFGVRSQRENDKMVYLLLCKDAGWIRKGGLHEDGKRLTLDRSWLVSLIQSYWRSELVSVGIKVLKTLKDLNNLMSYGSAFHQSTSLLHIFEVSKFLLECRYLNLTDNKKKKLENFLEISTSDYYCLVFPFDWRRFVCKDFMSLKETRLSLDLLDEIISQNVNNIKNDYTTPRIIGNVMTILCLGYRKPIALYDEILRVLEADCEWKRFFKEFWRGGLLDYTASFEFFLALRDCYKAGESPFRVTLPPYSLLYLLDCLLFTTSLSAGFLFTTKSSFLQWFTHLGSTSTTTSRPSRLLSQEFTDLVENFAKYQKCTASRLHDSKLDCLKLVMLLCLVCLKVRDSCKALRRLLVGKDNVASLLPEEFVSDLLRRMKGRDLKLNADVVAEAFMSVEDPLLIVSLENERPVIHAPSAIFVDVRRCSKEEIMNVLFPTEKKILTTLWKCCQKKKTVAVTVNT